MSENVEVKKKAKKLAKEINGNVVAITEVVTGKAMTFDFTKLPKDIQEKFGPFGLGHKLGDAAAGVSGLEAVENIEKVWAGLMEGNWSVKAPKGPSVSVKALNDGLGKLSPKEAEAAKALLAKLGVTV